LFFIDPAADAGDFQLQAVTFFRQNKKKKTFAYKKLAQNVFYFSFSCFRKKVSTFLAFFLQQFF
jgi:hypothetical protein